ncbi:MAG TPA: stress protein [Oxalobacteraceae bacterium]|nr:stress protein [Oxalobacteraceae bacterium]HCN91062.1 stress protein [Oxalobacteraceae bacterium]
MANSLMRFDPFGDIVRLSPFGGIDDLFKDFQLKPALRDLAAEPRIKMDVSETDQAYMVKAEIPGVKKEDIKVAVEGNQVSITAEIKKETEEKQGERVVRSERYYGQQSRSFTLANEIDDTQAVAKYQDGVLELSLPKKIGSGGAKQLTVN